jgi:hypothetical protein
MSVQSQAFLPEPKRLGPPQNSASLHNRQVEAIRIAETIAHASPEPNGQLVFPFTIPQLSKHHLNGRADRKQKVQIIQVQWTTFLGSERYPIITQLTNAGWQFYEENSNEIRRYKLRLTPELVASASHTQKEISA